MSTFPNPSTQFKSGEVGNPAGVNQYTYRDDAKKRFAELCKKNADGFLAEVFRLAKEGESWAAKMVWDEIMPAVKAVDVKITNEREPVTVPTTDERLTAVAELVAGTVH